MKKLFALLLALTMLLCCVPAFAANEAINPKGVLPIVKDGYEVELSIMLTTRPGTVESYEAEDNSFTAWVEEQTGLTLNFIAVPASDASTKLNAMFASGDYPDVIILSQNEISMADAAYYLEEGFIIPIDDLYEEYADNIKMMFEDLPALEINSRTYEGVLHTIYDASECIECQYNQCTALFYYPWLVKYMEEGHERPETVEELTEYMRWIRDTDVNGNGDPNDEIPLVSRNSDAMKYLRRWAMNMWLPYSSHYDGYAMYDGVIEAQYLKDEYRDCLRWLNSIYEEGLLYANSFTMDTQTLQAVTSQSDDYATCGIISSRYDSFDTSWGLQRGYFRMWAIEGKEGWKYIGYDSDLNNVDGEGQFYITDKCENPDAAFRLFEFFLSPEAEVGGNKEGITWRYAEEGDLNYYGEQAMFVQLDPPEDWNSLNTSWDVNKLSYGREDFGKQYNTYTFADGTIPEDQQVRAEIEEWLKGDDLSDYARFIDDLSTPDVEEGNSSVFFSILQEKMWEEYMPDTVPDEYYLPYLNYNADDSIIAADLEVNIDNYRLQAFVDYIVGERDVDNDEDWNTYLADLESMGVNDLLSIMNAYV